MPINEVVVGLVYSFYWWTNDDKPQHFTQAKYQETAIRKYVCWLIVECRLNEIKLAGCNALTRIWKKVGIVFARKHEAMDPASQST